MLIDLLLLAEVCWCTVWMRAKGFRESLVHAGGILASGYVATQISDWLATTFMPPASPAIQWVRTHLTADTQTVSTLSGFIPPEPTFAGFEHSQWIALHIVKATMFVGVTVAVFLVFTVVGSLVQALWDANDSIWPQRPLLVPTLVAAGSGFYVATLTLQLLVNLAWFKAFPILSENVSQSLLVHLLGAVQQSLPG